MSREDKLPPGLVVAGLGGGSGKSVVSVGLAAVFTAAGRQVAVFKKGPDYIDAGWLSLAAGSPCFNLDPYLMDEGPMLRSFVDHGRMADCILVEGNRGLFDGVSAHGEYSTAELARTLNLPVLLVVDCTKTTRTVAALVLGCRTLDPDLEIAGVVLNRIGSTRHEQVVREAVEKYAGVPVIGVIRRMKKDIFPMRHLGVTPFQEYDGAADAIGELAATAENCLELAEVEAMMRSPLLPPMVEVACDDISGQDKVRIGVIQDAAFQFYYPENLLALARAGAEIVEVNSLTAPELPELDGLYIGGGFPETSARLLADNVSFRRSIKEKVEEGLPVYAECGGLIYLGKEIVLADGAHSLVGIFPVSFTLEQRPQAHGYTVLTATAANPYYGEGTQIRGHEFRYSKVADWPGDGDDLGFTMDRGVGFSHGGDGLIYKNVLALYTHIHAVATPEWSVALVDRARQFKVSG